MPDYYAVLQVTSAASEEVIKAAYKTLVKKYHPDNGNIDSIEKLQLLNEAYEVLSDPCRRKQYDQKLEVEKNKIFSQNQETSCDSWTHDEREKTFMKQEERNPGAKKEGILQSILRGVTQEVHRNQQIIENAYYDGLMMRDDELIYAFKNNYGLKRQGYAKALEERDFLVNDDGTWKPTNKFKSYRR